MRSLGEFEGPERRRLRADIHRASVRRREEIVHRRHRRRREGRRRVRGQGERRRAGFGKRVVAPPRRRAEMDAKEESPRPGRDDRLRRRASIATMTRHVYRRISKSISTLSPGFTSHAPRTPSRQ